MGVCTAYIPVDQTVDTIASGHQKPVERGDGRGQGHIKASNETIFENHNSEWTGQRMGRGSM